MIRLPPEHAEALRRYAKNKNRSVSAVIAATVERMKTTGTDGHEYPVLAPKHRLPPLDG